MCRPSQLVISSDLHVPCIFKTGSYLKEAVYLEIWKPSMKGERQQETKRSSGFFSRDMGNSLLNLGMSKQKGFRETEGACKGI